MAYKRQDFVDNKTVLTAGMLKLIEDGIIDGDVSSHLLGNTALVDGVYNISFIKKNDRVVPFFEKIPTNGSYYFYDASSKGILSPNDMYKRTKLYSQTGQDGVVYEGLIFRGRGNGYVDIIKTTDGTLVKTMPWDKSALLKAHDNSMSKYVDRGEKALTTTWTLNSTYKAADGTIQPGTRAISPKLKFVDYKNIETTVSSCTFAVCCYDAEDTYLGQISTKLDSLIKGTAQWLPENTKITKNLITNLNNSVASIALCAYDNVQPTYSLSTFEDDSVCYLYSNVYNSYENASDKHIGECCVYSIHEDNGAWTNSLKQLIKIGFINDASLWSPSTEPRPYGNFVVDAENKYLYAYTMYTSKGLTYWHKFSLPSVTDGEWNDTYGCYVCTLNTEDIIDSWTTAHQNYIQGSCVYKSLIYSTEGFTGATGVNVARMRVIDPAEKKEIATLNFYADDDPVEPEFIDFYDGVCYYGSLQTVYTLELL